jgi:YHS domain-containing protein
MKILRVAVAVLLGTGFAWAFQSKPVNDTCPVKTGTAIKAGITSELGGKTVGFCCEKCKALFDADPARFASKVGPQPRVALNSIDAALKQGKEDAKPVVILFMDASAKSKTWAENLGDKDLDEAFAKVTYSAVVFDKDEAKKYGVSSAPGLVIVDPTAEGTKVLKTLTTSAPKTVKSEIEIAVKKVAKK